jgi:hypothetical protein
MPCAFPNTPYLHASCLILPFPCQFDLQAQLGVQKLICDYAIKLVTILAATLLLVRIPGVARYIHGNLGPYGE